MSNQPQPNTYTYTTVPHVPYPPLDSPFEVSPAPPSSSAQNEITPLSYQEDVVPKSYDVFRSTMEPELPAYETDRKQLPQQIQTHEPRQARQEEVVAEQPGRALEMTTTLPPMTQDWDHALFECCSTPSVCLAATFCTPCLYGHTASLLRQDELKRLVSTPNSTDNRHIKQQQQEPGYINSSCLLYTVLGIMTAGLGSCLLTASRRTAVRQRYGIAGEEWDDLCVGCFCVWCGVGQMEMEVRARMERE